MVVGLMHPGVDPADVLPAAADAAREHTTVEASELDILRGRPRLTVRYEALDDLTAATVGRAVVARVDEMVDVEGSRITRRFGARWYPMR